MSMYAQLAMRARAEDQFDRGIGGVIASFSPASQRAGIMNQWAGAGSMDPGALFDNMMKMTQYGMQMQNLQAFRQGIIPSLKSLGMSDEQAQALAPAALMDPTLVSKIAETQMGVGNPAYLAQKRAEAAYDAQGKPLPWTRGDPVSYDAYSKANAAAQVTTADAANKEKIATKSEFDGMNKQYNAAEQNIEWLADPANHDAVVQAIKNPEFFTTGQTGKWLQGTPLGVSQDVLDAKSRLDMLHNQLYSTSFSGKNQRLAAVEAQRLGNAYTNLNSPTLSPSAIDTELGRLKEQIYTSHANIYASAGQQVPSKYYGLADSEYFDPKEPLYNGATQEAPPKTVAPAAPAAAAGAGPAAAAAPAAAGPAASAAPAGGWALTGEQLSKVKAAIAANPSHRDTILAKVKANGFDTTGL